MMRQLPKDEGQIANQLMKRCSASLPITEMIVMKKTHKQMENKCC